MYFSVPIYRYLHTYACILVHNCYFSPFVISFSFVKFLIMCNFALSLSNSCFSSLHNIGKNYEKVCEMCHITLNKSAIFGDNGAFSPGGVRIGE